MKRGRKPNRKAIEQVREYLKKGLNKAEIARIIGVDPSQIQRWIKKLSPPSEK